MVLHGSPQKLKPEVRERRQNLALIRNPRAEHVIERRNAVGRDEQQLVGQLVNVAHLAARKQWKGTEAGGEQGFSHSKTVPLSHASLPPRQPRRAIQLWSLLPAEVIRQTLHKCRNH